MKLTLILLFTFGFYSAVFSQPQFNANSIGSHYYKFDDPASLDTFPSFSNNLQEQAVLKSSESNRLLLDSIVHESWEVTVYGPTYFKAVEIYGYEGNGTIQRELLRTYTFINYENEPAKNEYSKNEYTKDENTHIIISYWWDNNRKIWKELTKEEQTYDEKNRRILMIGSVRDSNANIWTGTYKIETQYDENSLFSNEIECYWDNSLHKWKNINKIETSLDSLGRTIDYKVFKWRDDLNYWIKYIRTETSYESDTLTQQINYTNLYYRITDTIDWNPNQKTIITYYPDGRKKKTISTTWDSVFNKWGVPSINYYEYDLDSIGHIMLNISYVWNYNVNDWENSNRQEYAYDKNGNKVIEKRYKWNSDSADWIVYRNTQYGYDNNDNVVFYLNSNYDEMGSINKYKEIMTYNKDGYQEQVFSYRWEQDIDDWHLYNKYTFYYFEYTSNVINKLNNTDLLIYPNPTSEKLYFNLNQDYNSEITLEIFDISGEKIHSGILEQNSISTAGLENGMYFYHLMTGEKSFTGKFIVQH